MSVRTLRLVIAPLCLLALTACSGKEATKITYQHLANCKTYIQPVGTDGRLQVFMLRGVVNPGDAPDFLFNLGKVHQNHVTPGNAGAAAQLMTNGQFTEFLPVGFTAKVSKGSDYTIPVGTGALFVIYNEGAESTTRTFLNYKSSKSESVLMQMLDSNSTPIDCGEVDAASVAAIRSLQSEFEYKYTAYGQKK